MLADQVNRCLGVIERRNQHLIRNLLGDAGGIGHRLREVARLRRRHAHQGVIAHAVKPALKLQNLVSAPVGARHAHGVEGGFGAA